MSVDFYREYREACLPRIAGVFGLPYIPGDDASNANVFNEAFKGARHGELNVPMSAAQADAARPELVQLGFAQPQMPLRLDFDATFAYGARNGANVRRSQLCRDMAKQGYALGERHLLTGQRTLEPLDGNPIELIKGINRDAFDLPWVRMLTYYPLWVGTWDLTEFHVWTAIELALDPGMMRLEVIPAVNDKPVYGVPPRDILAVRFRQSDGGLLTIHNCAAIERTKQDGTPNDPRHTTMSCTEEVTELYPDLLATGQNVCIVNGNPHAERMLGDTVMTLEARQRHPNLHLAATSLPADHERFVPLALHELGIREFNTYLL